MLIDDEPIAVPVLVGGLLLGYSDEPGVLELAESLS